MTVKKGDELIKVGDGEDGWIEVLLKGIKGRVPDYQVYQREPIIVFISRNEGLPRIVKKESSKVTMTKSNLYRTMSTPQLNQEHNDRGNRMRRNSL